MAEQPERPIERLLRDTGKQRVPSEPLELHGATRRLLQAEVARTYGQAEGTAWSWWANLRWTPKLAWACSAVLLIGIGTWIFMSSTNGTGRQSLLANKQEAVPPALQADRPAPNLPQERAPAKESTTLLANNPAAPVQDKAVDLVEQTASQTGALAAPSIALARSEAAKNLVEQRELASAPAASSAPPIASASGGAVARYGLASRAMPALKDNYRLDLSQRFVLEEANQLKTAASPGTSAVLVSFQLERTGSEVRVTDRDGSVYIGLTTNSATALQPDGSTTTAPAFSQVGATVTIPPKAASSARDFFFEVSGTNRTLQQPVVFSGRWSGPGGTVSATPASGMNRGLTPQPGSGAPTSQVPSRVYGRAVVGGSRQITIQAVSGQP